MFKDKHVIVAMLVAPVLALIAWFGVDQIVAEKPQPAVAGGSYTLLAKSNCRYESGRCDLENADLEVSLVPATPSGSTVEMQLSASIALQGATLGLVNEGIEATPSPMARISDDATRWTTMFPMPASNESLIRVAIVAGGATWFAEVPTIFLKQPAD